MKYRAIDHLLLNVNKGPDQAMSSKPNPAFPRPGDYVTVSAVDGRILSLLIHQVESGGLAFKGKTMAPVHHEDGRQMIDSGDLVSFSYKKIASIRSH